MKNHIQEIVALALAEDLPQGDVTTDALGVKEKLGRAKLVAKQDLVLSGVEPFQETLNQFSKDFEVIWHFKEGDLVFKGQTLATVIGNLIPLIKAERIALNFLGRLSGISTLTQKFVQAVAGTNCKILDTRKTTPGWRILEKQAVVHGGGYNHRMNLSDSILIKENHLAIGGGIINTIEQVRKTSPLPVEIEVKSTDEALLATEQGVTHLLLDNMSLEVMSETLEVLPKGITTEASGNMTLERVRSVAELGVQYISVGALTHSAPCADFSLLFDWKGENS